MNFFGLIIVPYGSLDWFISFMMLIITTISFPYLNKFISKCSSAYVEKRGIKYFTRSGKPPKLPPIEIRKHLNEEINEIRLKSMISEGYHNNRIKVDRK